MARTVWGMVLVLLCQFTVLAGRASGSATHNPVLETRYFRFYSNFWVNLHHYIFQQAAYVHFKKVSAEDKRIDRFLRKSGQTIDAEEGDAILAALAFYEKELVTRDLTSDTRLHKIKTALTQTAPGEAAPLAEQEPEMGKILAAVAPTFRKYHWSRQDRSNRAWIEDQRKLVEEISEEMVNGLAALYGVPWPEDKIPIDLCGSYTHWAGAYTTGEPNHVVISSTREGYRGLQGLEMIFHECSHIPFADQSGPIPRTIAEKSAAHGIAVPKNLWHAILFYTSGEFTRRVLLKRELSHQPYMLRNDVFKKYHAVLTEFWQPYMDTVEETWTRPSTRLSVP